MLQSLRTKCKASWLSNTKCVDRKSLSSCLASFRLQSTSALNETPSTSTARPNRMKIALVGRTNVGKSTLFNRLTNSRSAIVNNSPCTTRDRREKPGRLAGFEFTVVDTGGLEDEVSISSGTLEGGMLHHTSMAIRDADLVFFLIDGRSGVTIIDKHFATWLRKETGRHHSTSSSTSSKKVPINLVVNKLEGYNNSEESSALSEFYELGMGAPIPISAEHGEGIPLLLDEIMPIASDFEEAAAAASEKAEEEEQEQNDDSRSLSLAIVGRPNVGKSTLLNQLIREDRVLTGPTAGVTRDAIDVEWEFASRQIKLIDTAGIRRHGKREVATRDIENLAVRDAENAMGLAQVVVLVGEINEGKLFNMDLSIAQRVCEEGRALVIVANKLDLLGKDTKTATEVLRNQLDMSLAQVRGVPIIATSAERGDGVRRLMPTVLSTFDKWNTRINTGKLNRWLRAMERHHPPPSVSGGKQLKVKYMTQVKARPPTFALFVNYPNKVPESYKRFLMNEIRVEFDFVGVPIRFLFRGNDEETSAKYKPAAKAARNRRLKKSMAANNKR